MEKIAFWKGIYSEYDSSVTIIYNKKTLHTYAIVKNEYLVSTLDSIKKVTLNPNQIMVKQGRREFIHDAILRAETYSFVVDSLTAHNLHPDLRWLPVLESGYLDTMISDQDARGIWQFIPSTAKKFGLLPFEIAEPHKSTKAFVHYFSFLLGLFGDYGLALTAYHHGEGGVSSKLKKNGTASLDGIIDQLGFQSGNYYARFLAVVDIAGIVTGDTLIDRIDSAATLNQ